MMENIVNKILNWAGLALMFGAVAVAITVVETPDEPLSLPVVRGIAIVAFLFGNVLRVCAGKDSFFDFVRLRRRA